MEEMTSEERRKFLLDKPRTAKVATVRPDNTPHVAPVWFTLDGDDVIFTTWHTTVKAHNLAENPHVALVVADDDPPYAFVLIEGEAEVAKHAPDLLKWTTALARRYFGDDLAEPYGQRNAVEGEYLVRVHPTKFVAQKGIAD